MATQITTLTAGYITIQAGHGIPSHVASKGSQYTDVDTAIIYYNKDGLNDWQLDGGNAFTGGTVVGYTTFLNGLSATTISASTFYGDGSYLTGISTQDTFVTGGTYNSGTATFTNNTGGTFTVNGFKTSDIYTTGGTYSNGSTIFTNNTGGTFTINGFYTGYTAPIDIYVTGGTYSNGSTMFTNNTGGTFNVNGFFTGTTEIFVTGGTYSNGTAIFTNNTGGTFNVNGFLTGTTDTYTTGFTYNNNVLTLKRNANQPDLDVLINAMSGLTVNGGLITNTISATTYYNLPTPIDIYVTGGTYSNGSTMFTNNTGGTFNVNGFFKSSDDIYTSGLTFNTATYDLSVKRNDGTVFTQNLGLLASDMTITGGTYSSLTGVATFTNNTGGTFNVSGFLTGMTDTYTTGFTYNNNNVLTLKRNANQPDLNVLINAMSGLTVNGDLTVTGSSIFNNSLTTNTISATTYYNLPQDIRTTGITVSNGSVAFNRNDSMSAYTVSFSGLNINVISDDINKRITFSASTGGSSLPVLNQAQIFIGDTLNTVQARSVSGDISLNFSGLTTIQPNVVTYSKMQTVSTNALLGSQSISGGTVEEIPFIDAYLISGSVTALLLENDNNWDIDGVYIGTTLTSTYQGQSYYSNKYWFTAVDDNNWIRLIRG